MYVGKNPARSPLSEKANGLFRQVKKRISPGISSFMSMYLAYVWKACPQLFFQRYRKAASSHLVTERRGEKDVVEVPRAISLSTAQRIAPV